MNEKNCRFEGTEKKLEILFEPSLAGLRSNSLDNWRRVVAASGSTILSSISTEHLDAYLLSESSLFVWDDRILLITCGQTVLTRSLPALLEFVEPEDVKAVVYRRKNMMYPEDQPAGFDEDAGFLFCYFPGTVAFVGRKESDHVHLFYSSPGNGAPARDITIEILMYGLDKSTCDRFLRGSTDASSYGLHFDHLERLMPGSRIDDHIFSPFGYSQNRILSDLYATIHVTPQPWGSYASFETNLVLNDYGPLVKEVVKNFKPERFCVIFSQIGQGSTGSFELMTDNKYECLAKDACRVDGEFAAALFEMEAVIPDD